MSTAKACREAVYTLCQTISADGPHGLAVVYDLPSATPTDDIVAVAHTERVSTPFGMVGAMIQGSTADEVSVHVVVEVFRAGYDPKAVNDRCEAVVDAIETAVRADPTLGGAVYVARVTQTTYECVSDETHKGLIGTSEITVTCKAIT